MSRLFKTSAELTNNVALRQNFSKLTENLMKLNDMEYYSTEMLSLILAASRSESSSINTPCRCRDCSLPDFNGSTTDLQYIEHCDRQ